MKEDRASSPVADISLARRIARMRQLCVDIRDSIKLARPYRARIVRLQRDASDAFDGLMFQEAIDAADRYVAMLAALQRDADDAYQKLSAKRRRALRHHDRLHESTDPVTDRAEFKRLMLKLERDLVSQASLKALLADADAAVAGNRKALRIVKGRMRKRRPAKKKKT